MGLFQKKLSVPKFIPTDIDAEQRDAIAANQEVFGAASNLAQSQNFFNLDQTIALSNRMFPGLLDQSIANTRSQLRGEITPEILQQNRDLVAASALNRGAGGTQFQLGMEGARNLVSALQLQQQGQQNFMALQGLMPQQVSPASMFLSPAQRAQFNAQQNEARWNVLMAKAQAKAQPSALQQFGQDALSMTMGAMLETGMSWAKKPEGI